MEIHDSLGGSPARQVSDILCDQAVLSSQSNFTAMNEEILTAGNVLIRPGLGHAISCQETFLSSYVDGAEELPAERQASQRVYLVRDTQIVITVYVWVVG